MPLETQPESCAKLMAITGQLSKTADRLETQVSRLSDKLSAVETKGALRNGDIRLHTESLSLLRDDVDKMQDRLDALPCSEMCVKLDTLITDMQSQNSNWDKVVDIILDVLKVGVGVLISYIIMNGLPTP